MPLPRLLVIDDELRIRRMLARGLRPVFAVECVGDAESALAMIGGGAVFDAIICDLNLPRMSGRDFYDALKSRSRDLAARMIVVSGTPPARDDAFAAMLGERYVMKPCSMPDLTATLVRVASHA